MVRPASQPVVVFALLLTTLPAATKGQGAVDVSCIVMNADRMPVAERESQLDSVSFRIYGAPVKICYSRPAARGRTMLGGPDVPFGRIWGTGDNEPAMIHTSVDLIVAGIRLFPGSYSLYTVPGRGQWEIILNRSTSQWGQESYYTQQVREQEVGRAGVPSERLDNYVERFTIRVRPAPPNNATVVIEWEHTQVLIPIGKG